MIPGLGRREVMLALAAASASGLVPLPVRGGGAHTASGYLRTNWSRDRYSLGSYSYVARGTSQGLTADLGAPVGGRLFFAGEATHPDYNSTVHAAYESGRIAADAVLRGDAGRIAVIGAGAAGMAAANRLVAQGRQVTLLEARRRIGGRIWTSTRLGMPLDLGASWIHGRTGNPLTGLARKLGARTLVTRGAYVVRGQGGRQISPAQEPDWLEEITEIQHSAGADKDRLNLRAFRGDKDYGGSDLLFPGGYGQILAALSPRVRVLLERELRKVQDLGGQVRLTDAAGRADAFDAVIVTVPLGVLKQGRIRFDPPLPARKQAAIRSLGYGLLDKLYLRYRSVFWDAEATWILTPENGLPRGYFNQWLNLWPYIGQPVIVAFNAAGPARDLSARSDAQVVAMAEQTLRRAYP